MGYLSQLLSGKTRFGNEFIGTFIFVLVGTSVLTAISLAWQNTPTPAPTMALGITAFSLTLGWLVYLLKSPQIGHFNPAVTLLLWLRGVIPLKTAGVYIICQIFGAIAASVAVAFLYGSGGVEVRLGAIYPQTTMGAWAAFGAELIGTAIFLAGVSAAMASSTQSRLKSATLIGISFALGYSLAAGVSGGGLNPARALAPQLVAADLSGWWIYLTAPLFAAIGVSLIGGSESKSEQQAKPRQATKPAASTENSAEQKSKLEPDDTDQQQRREDEQQKLTEKAQQAIAKLREANPNTRELPSNTPKPTFYQPDDQPESTIESTSTPPEEPIRPSSANNQPKSSKGPDVRFVEFNAEDDPSDQE